MGRGPLHYHAAPGLVLAPPPNRRCAMLDKPADGSASTPGAATERRPARDFQAHLAEKVIRPTGGDPVDDLRAGWDLHIGFGLANPPLYALMYGDPRPPAASPANAQAFRVLRAHVRRVAEVGRLRVGEEHAVNLVHASGCGTVLTLLAMPEEHRDPALAELAREAVIAAITTDAPTLQAPGPVGAAAALRAVLDETEKLTVGERGVLKEWLDRITAG